MHEEIGVWLIKCKFADISMPPVAVTQYTVCGQASSLGFAMTTNHYFTRRDDQEETSKFA